MEKKSVLLASVGLTAIGMFAIASPSGAAAPTIADQSTAGTSGPTEVGAVVVTGVRGRPRTLTTSPVEIDIISAKQLTTTGKAGLKQILTTVVPSLNIPGEMSGLSAAAPPYSVEGLTGDYVLVLVNGKRRHNTAIINNLATVGGGSTPVDLDMIPPDSIDHIEYLRDGAAAQYGSDAVAGVLNIILKSSGAGGNAETMAGQTYQKTGQLVQENADWGAPFYQGSINFALSAVHHMPAPASENAPGLFYPLVNGQPDPREATISKNLFQAYGLTQNTNQIDLSYNLSTPIGGGLEVYSFSTFSYRNITDMRGDSRPDDLNSLPTIYPNGFQPRRIIRETDFQVAGGLKGQAAGWQWDASSTYGRDFVFLGAEETLNPSLGPSVDQTSFHVGNYVFDQWTNNLDVTRSFQVGFSKPLDVSWGLEHRWERYALVAGEPNSYLDGGYVVANDGTPFGNLWHGVAEPAGAANASPINSADASTHSRNNYAAYVDLGTNVTTPWYVGLAGRAEHYDDSSGNSLSGKFTTRYEILPGLALRASVGNAFHAPSLAEQWFSSTQYSTVINPMTGQTSQAQVKFLPVGSPAAVALGSTPLRPETSVNYAAGLTYSPTSRFRATVDVYEIDVTNRIVKSSPTVNPAAQAILNTLGYPGLSSAQFFTNGVDTRTKGIDAVLEYQKPLDQFGDVHLSATYSANTTNITRVLANASNFNVVSQEQLIKQTPRYRLQFDADWTVDKWNVNLTESLYGPYEEPLNSTVDMDFGAKWLTDLDVSYKITRMVTVSVGANNLFNAFPDRQPASKIALLTTDVSLTHAPGYTAAAYGVPLYGAFQYGQASPFGFQGGFYYMRVGVKF